MDKVQKIKTRLLEIENRWLSFLSKLEDRMNELGEAAVIEINESYNDDSDPFKKGNFISGIIGQMRSIEDKAEQVNEEKVSDPLEELEEEIDDLDNDDLKELFEKIRDTCDISGEKFSDKVDHWIEKIENSGEPDPEKEYQAVLDEYEQIKDKFSCKQCGSPITIPRIFLSTTFITCPSCQTQNTFEPSSRAASLDFIGRSLAEQRTRHLLDIAVAEEDKERDLYDQIHQLEIQKISHEIDNNTKEITELNRKIGDIEKLRQESILKAPELHKKYLTAKFEEWIRLVPQLEEQNRKIYESWLKDYENKTRRITK